MVVPGDGGPSRPTLQPGHLRGVGRALRQPAPPLPPQQPCLGVPRGTKWLHPVPQEGTGMVASLSAPVLEVGWVGEKVPLLMAAVPSPPLSLSSAPPPGHQPPVIPPSAGSLSCSDRNQLHASALRPGCCFQPGPGPGPVPTPQEKVTALRWGVAGGPVPPEPPDHQPPARNRSHGTTAFPTGSSDRRQAASSDRSPPPAPRGGRSSSGPSGLRSPSPAAVSPAAPEPRLPSRPHRGRRHLPRLRRGLGVNAAPDSRLGPPLPIRRSPPGAGDRDTPA